MSGNGIHRRETSRKTRIATLHRVLHLVDFDLAIGGKRPEKQGLRLFLTSKPNSPVKTDRRETSRKTRIATSYISIQPFINCPKIGGKRPEKQGLRPSKVFAIW